MRRFLAVLGLGLIVAVPAGAKDESIEGFIDVEMPASGVPGVAYAVVADGTITSAGAHGVVEMGDGREVTPDTPFLIGSISKSFTALAVMQLVEAGEIDLDTEVSGYLDGFSGRPAGIITVRQLLSHTSGFSTLQGNESHTDVTGGEDELARRDDALAEVDPAYDPDERWEYSNANYLILGRLIEVVSGQDYQAYIAANILEPVGMEQSFVADGEIFQTERLRVFLGQEADEDSIYQVRNAIRAVGTGGVWGKGWLQGELTHNRYVPVMWADFPFAAVGEQFGFVGCAVLLSIFVIAPALSGVVPVNGLPHRIRCPVCR